MITETEHLKIVEDIKTFFKDHLEKLKSIIAKKQKNLKTKDEFIYSLQKKLQSISIELENNKLQFAEQKSVYFNIQQEYQQLKVNKLVYEDEISNHQRETGSSLIF